MTAITLNLLAEEQLAQVAKGRDPVKIAAAISIFSVTIMLAAGTAFNMLASQSKAQANALQHRWTALGGDSNAGVDQEFVVAKAFADDLVEINKGHALFAPQLALIKDVVPETILLTQLGFSIITESQATAIPQPVENKKGDNTSPAKPMRPAPPKTTEHLMLHLEGKILSARPEIEADTFINTLRAHPILGPQFKTVQLKSIARPQGIVEKAGDSAPSAVFVIECEYKERS